MKKIKSTIKSTSEVSNVGALIQDKISQAIETAVNECSQEFHRKIEVNFAIKAE